jgi:hypothetical protein
VIHVDVHTWPSTGRAARSLGLSTQRVRQFITDGRLAAESTPFGWLIEPSSLAKLQAARDARIAARGVAS